jgi:hypothetical protein
MAPLIQLASAARKAEQTLRMTRVPVLYERALAAAEAALPADSLVVASLLHELSFARIEALDDSLTGQPTHASRVAAWRNDAAALSLSQRCLGILLARWRAGSLFTLTPEEREFCCGARNANIVGGELYICCAANASAFWPPLRTPVDEQARLRGVHGALQAVLHLCGPRVCPLTGQPEMRREFAFSHMVFQELGNLLQYALHSSAVGGILEKLRATGGLSHEEQSMLAYIAPTVLAKRGECSQRDAEALASRREKAAADVARHGLRCCALPACGATEAHPKLYKLCGRCRGAAYCCAAHAAEDWKRHKREDGCRAAVDGAKDAA